MSVSRGGRVCDRRTCCTDTTVFSKSPVLKRATQLPPNRRLLRGGGGAPGGRSSTATRPRPPSSTMAAAMPSVFTPPLSHHSSSSGLAMGLRRRVEQWGGALAALSAYVYQRLLPRSHLRAHTKPNPSMHSPAVPPPLPPPACRTSHSTALRLGFRIRTWTVTDRQNTGTQLCNI